MKQLRELTIMTPNKPGKLAQVLRTLARAKINLQAVDSASGYDLNLVRLITSDQTTAKTALETLGYQVSEATVLGVTAFDRPGQLARITGALGRAKVNINYMYATAATAEALVVISLSDLAAGEEALQKTGWK